MAIGYIWNIKITKFTKICISQFELYLHKIHICPSLFMRYEFERLRNYFIKFTLCIMHKQTSVSAVHRVNHFQLFVTTRHVASRTPNSGSNGSAMANAKLHANINGTLPKMIIIRGCAVRVFAKKSHIFRESPNRICFAKRFGGK